MMILIPSTLIFFCMKEKDKAFIPVGFSGILVGVFVCIMTSLFSFLHRIPEYSFSSNFTYYFFREYILPLAILYAVYFIFTKDEFSFKIKSFFPLSAGFSSIYMPYMIIASNRELFSFFELFCKPVIWLSLLVIMQFSLTRISISAVQKKTKSLMIYSVIMAFALFIPPFLNSLWITNWLRILSFVVGISYVFFAAIITVFSLLNSSEIKIERQADSL